MIAHFDEIKGVPLPKWVFLLNLAELWHIPPWKLEKAPAIWVIRAAEYYSLRAKIKGY